MTLEQDNRDPKDEICRVYIATQDSAPNVPGDGKLHDLVAPPQLFTFMKSSVLSIGHDADDVAHGTS